MSWDEIKAEYKAFVDCVFTEIEKQDKAQGKIHLLNAYVKAQRMQEKNHLIYARILLAMYQVFECSTYKKISLSAECDGFLEDARREYKLAWSDSGEKPTEKEMHRLSAAINVLQTAGEQREYELEQMKNVRWHYEEHLKLIDNYELLKDFVFHDGVILNFEHLPAEQAVILQICEEYFENAIPGKIKVLTLRFDGVKDLKYEYEHDYRWISEAYFYKSYFDKSVLVFDLDVFRIYCNKITATNVEIIDTPDGFSKFLHGGME